jgi:type IV pilus assembly protein PilA
MMNKGSMMNYFKRQEGFTLVELMVVVAIIGILSAVAVPQFRRYQAKSKTSEAKVNLSAVYTAEISHFTDMDQYSSCLNLIGYTPGGTDNDRYYTTGFSGVDVAGGVTPPGGSCNGANISYFVGTKGASSDANAELAGASVLTTAIDNTVPSFTAGSAGTIDPGAGRADIWSVNQDKSVQHLQTGY